MNLSELFIRRPVMTVLLNAVMVVAGVIAYRNIPVSALPSYNTPVINVSGSLPGASPDTMAASVALPMEKQFATIPGVTTISSSSSLGSTSITLEFDQNRDIDAAAVDVQAALLRVQRALPQDMTSPPSYRKVNPADAPILFVALTSPSMAMSDLNDYAEHLISPNLSTIDGVALVNIFGAKRYAVRVSALPQQLAAQGLSLNDIATALRSANGNTPLGTLEGKSQLLSIGVTQQLRNADDFAKLIISNKGGSPVRLGDVAQVTDSYENIKTAASYNGQPSITLAIQRQGNANTIQVVDSIRALLPKLQSQLPESVQISLLNDRSVSIRNSLHDVGFTLAGTIALVVMVIFLFLRHVVATLIPTLSLPISLVGAVALLGGLSYSLDNISLMGLTLAVGLVVDDAIVMLENIMRHVENGEKAFVAALRGSREVGFTIISISISLIAVFIPIFFMPGVIGLLFHEFAVVVMLAIVVSAFVSLTLVPMLASRLLHPEAEEKPPIAIVQKFEAGFNRLLASYTRTLDMALERKNLVLGVALLTFAMTIALFYFIPKGFFPEEDIGQISGSTEAAQDISFTEMTKLQAQVAAILRKDPNVATVSSFNGGSGTQNSGRLFINLKPRSERASMTEVMDGLRKKVRSVPGISVFLRPIQNLQMGGRSSKSQYQYVMQSVKGDQIALWATKLQEKLRADPLFSDVTSDAQTAGTQVTLDIDRDRASAIGVSMSEIRDALNDAFAQHQISTIYTPVDSYQVILEADASTRMDESALSTVFVHTSGGGMVPISNFTTVKREPAPTSIQHVGQLQAVTVSFNLAPGAALGAATQKITQYSEELQMPSSINASYGGDAAVFKNSQSGQGILIVTALVVIYVLLGVLYESYIHPLTILAGLPSAAAGALMTLMLFGQSLTIIATIGILLLIGVVKKNAIMMIDFALDAQRQQGMRPYDAIREACILRFRPIMMTTLAAFVGAVPIALGIGEGSEVRQPLGLAVIGGLLFSQAITLYITPVIYLALDKYSGSGPDTRPEILQSEVQA